MYGLKIFVTHRFLKMKETQIETLENYIKLSIVKIIPGGVEAFFSTFFVITFSIIFSIPSHRNQNI